MTDAEILSGVATATGAPCVDHLSLRSEYNARRRNRSYDVISCPYCHGEAWAEKQPTTLISNGKSREVRMATCRNGCKQDPDALRSRRKRFEIAGAPTPFTPREPYEGRRRKSTEKKAEKWLEERAIVKAAIERGETTAYRAGKDCGLNPSYVAYWINTGTSLRERDVAELLAWAKNIKEPVLSSLDRKLIALLPVTDQGSKKIGYMTCVTILKLLVACPAMSQVDLAKSTGKATSTILARLRDLDAAGLTDNVDGRRYPKPHVAEIINGEEP